MAKRKRVESTKDDLKTDPLKREQEVTRTTSHNKPAASLKRAEVLLGSQCGGDAAKELTASRPNSKEEEEPSRAQCGEVSAPLFATGHGKPVTVSAEVLLGSQCGGDAAKELTASRPNSKQEEEPSRAQCGEVSAPLFATGHGKPVTVSAASLKRAEVLLGSQCGGDAAKELTASRPNSKEEEEPSRAQCGEVSAPLFATGHGKPVTVSAASLKRAEVLLGSQCGGDAAKELTASRPNSKQEEEPSRAQCGEVSAPLFATGHGKPVTVSAASLKRAEVLLGSQCGGDAAKELTASRPNSKQEEEPSKARCKEVSATSTTRSVLRSPALSRSKGQFFPPRASLVRRGSPPSAASPSAPLVEVGCEILMSKELLVPLFVPGTSFKGLFLREESPPDSVGSALFPRKTPLLQLTSSLH